MDKKFFDIFTPGSKLIFFTLFIFVFITSFFNWVVFWVELGVAILIFVYYISSARVRQKDMVKYIETITSNIDSAAKSSVLNFPLPMAVINYKGELSWFNEKFGNIFDGENTFMFEKQILELFPTLNLKTIIDGTVSQPIRVDHDNRYFNIYVSTVSTGKKSNAATLITLYFFECTDYVKLKTELADKKSAVGIVMIDNYDDIMVGAKEMERSNALTKIDELVWGLPLICLLRKKGFWKVL
jgi:c-di-AMP phosphodiesterase-like protein